MRVTVVRHHAEDSAGFVAAAFEARGAKITTHLFPEEGPLPAIDDADHLVVLGAIPSVYDDGPARAWIGDELAWLREADEAGRPVFGICFGAQALCAALGGRVEPAARKEVGWTMIESFDPDLIPPGPWLQFHGDRCRTPPRAKILAVNEIGVQAFSIGRHLAVQFHPEVDGAQLKRWLDAGGRAEAERAGQNPEQFLAETVAQEPAASKRADRLVAAAILLAQGS
jgi:GMP synthase-like glutamine amidotransferase